MISSPFEITFSFKTHPSIITINISDRIDKIYDRLDQTIKHIRSNFYHINDG